jgi:hypothetical protein
MNQINSCLVIEVDSPHCTLAREQEVADKERIDDDAACGKSQQRKKQKRKESRRKRRYISSPAAAAATEANKTCKTI